MSVIMPILRNKLLYYRARLQKQINGKMALNNIFKNVQRKNFTLYAAERTLASAYPRRRLDESTAASSELILAAVRGV